MDNHNLIDLLESIKRRYCQAIKAGHRDVMQSELSRMEEVRTLLYKWNKSMGVGIFQEIKNNIVQLRGSCCSNEPTPPH